MVVGLEEMFLRTLVENDHAGEAPPLMRAAFHAPGFIKFAIFRL